MKRAGLIVVEGAAVETSLVHPPSLLSSSYTDLLLDSRAYYARETKTIHVNEIQPQPQDSCKTRKRKRKQKKKQEYTLNPKELLAEQRHKEARNCLLDSHQAFMSNEAAQMNLKNIFESNSSSVSAAEEQVDFVQISRTFQAPLYEISFLQRDNASDVEEYVPLFNNLVEADPFTDELVTCAGCSFVLPKGSRFLMSDFSQIHQLIPETPSSGYNLLIIDPPWENKSVHRKSLYPTLPNKNLLSLPLQRLIHDEGALVGLWITNREKLHQFVERELFPAWGVVPAGVWYWLKITETGALISDLDLYHHKPYECLLLARVPKDGVEVVPLKRVTISIPGQHSRKPPLGLLLEELAPGPRPVKALELFAREMHQNWTSWGNEPLHFQSKQYFIGRNAGKLQSVRRKVGTRGSP